MNGSFIEHQNGYQNLLTFLNIIFNRLFSLYTINFFNTAHLKGYLCHALCPIHSGGKFSTYDKRVKLAKLRVLGCISFSRTYRRRYGRLE